MKRPVFTTLLTCILLVACGLTAKAQGSLLITPRRVVLTNNKKMQELNLANTGKDTATYVISIINMRMKEDGNFEEITQPDSGQNFANNNIRIYPRKVTLGPNKTQMVKIQSNKTEQLAGGEYRSHLYFRAVPDERHAGGQSSSDSADIAVKLTPVFGLVIPVIVRVGQPDIKVTLGNLSVHKTDTSHVLNVTIQRQGNMSVYGDLVVDYVSAEGATMEVAHPRGIAVYTPNTKRNFEANLANLPGVDYNKGKLHIQFRTDKDEKAETLADAMLQLK